VSGGKDLYPAGLQELGFIVDNSGAGYELKTRYADPLWKYSSEDAFIDPQRGVCKPPTSGFPNDS
jgi:hypothetical protein